MASYSVAPGGPAAITNQGNTLYCTHQAVAKAVGNGFWNKKFSLTNQVDFDHGYIMQSLICEHKASISLLPVGIVLYLILLSRMIKQNGLTYLME